MVPNHQPDIMCFFSHPRRLADIFPQPGHDAAEQIDARSHDLRRGELQRAPWRKWFFYEKMRWRCHKNQQKCREHKINDDMKMTAKHVNMIEYEYLRLYLPIVDVKWCKYAGHPTNALILKHQNYVGRVHRHGDREIDHQWYVGPIEIVSGF